MFHMRPLLFFCLVLWDVAVQRTVKGIAESRDEVLEKAISVASQ